MKIDTRHFGEIEIDDEKIVDFVGEVFGFEDLKKYVLLYDDDGEGNPFAWLQSIENKDVCLPLVNPMLWFPDYEPEVADEVIESIGELDQSALDVYTVVVIPERIESMTTNLKAPIIINHLTKKATQVIAKNDSYEIRHNLYEQLQQLNKAGE